MPFIIRILKRSPPARPESAQQIRLTIIHELDHYFGMDENQLKDALAKKRAGLAGKEVECLHFVHDCPGSV